MNLAKQLYDTMPDMISAVLSENNCDPQDYCKRWAAVIEGYPEDTPGGPWPKIGKIVAWMREDPNPRLRTLHLVVYPYNRTYATFDADKVDDDKGWCEGNGENATLDAIRLAAREVGLPNVKLLGLNRLKGETDD